MGGNSDESLLDSFGKAPPPHTELVRLAKIGATMLAEDWQHFIGGDEFKGLLTDGPVGNLAAMCFPNVKYPEQMESIAYALEYCLRQSKIAREAHQVIQETLDSLWEGQYCHPRTDKIATARDIKRVQLIIADRCQLTRPIHNRGFVFTMLDQARALSDLSPGHAVRPDQILSNVVRLFRLNDRIPSDGDYHKTWSLVLESMRLTTDYLVLAEPLPSTLAKTTKSSRIWNRWSELRISETGDTPATALENVNRQFLTTKAKLEERGGDDPLVASFLPQWQALMKGYFDWGKHSDMRTWMDECQLPGSSTEISVKSRKRTLPPSQSLSLRSAGRTSALVRVTSRRLLEDEE